MSYFCLASPASSDAATIAGAPTPGGFEPAYLQTLDATEVCQFSSAGSMYVTLDFGVPVTRNLLWVGYGSAGVSATMRLRAASSALNLTSAPVYDSGVRSWWVGGVFLPDFPTSDAVFAFPHAPITARWWRVDWTDAAPLAFGRLYLVDAWFPSIGPLFGWKTGYVEEPDVLVSQAKRRYPRPGRPRRWAEWGHRFNDSGEIQQHALELARVRGVNRDVLAIENPYTTGLPLQHGIVYGLLSELPGCDNTTLNIHETRYRIEEL